MISVFGSRILKVGQVSRNAMISTTFSNGRYAVRSLTQYTPQRGFKLSAKESENLVASLPTETIKQYEADFKFTEAEVPNPTHELVKAGKEKLIGTWLLLTAAGVFGMILLGGYTRLSKSGLSMTSWKPIDYKLPSSDEAWEKEFTNYKQYPEFLLANRNMDVNGFKKIFFVEWAHRLWGSSLGVLFGVPLAAFTALGWIKRPMGIRLGAMLGFGGLQGLIGWWMVKSGFEAKPEYQNRPRVSVYRLFTHLNMAVLLYSGLLWNGLTLVRKPIHNTLAVSEINGSGNMRKLCIGLLHFVALNIMSGAIVAGIDAGKGFNTWPDMNGQMVPDGLMKAQPWYLNFFENKVLVQFNHRNCAYLTTAWTSFMLYRSLNLRLAKYQRFSVYMLSTMILYQVANGINTLLQGAPVRRASEHQASALIAFTIAMYTTHSFRKPSKQYLAFLQNYLKSKVVV